MSHGYRAVVWNPQIPTIGNVRHGLMLVDLLDVKPALLLRCLGRQGAAEFLAHHTPAVAALDPPHAL